MEDYYAFLPKTEEEYLQTRVLDQIKWYDKKSSKNKRKFLGMKIAEIILALFIPFLSGYIHSEGDPLKVIIGVLGIVVAAIAGLITLIKYQENWIEYRTTAESLKFEKFLFLSKAGPYKDVTASYPLFVERFESLISTSTKKWVEYISKKESKPSVEN
jgi:intein/homing endonuclease